MESYSSKWILQTLVYSDVFDYPLTEEELWLFLKTEEPIKKDAFIHALSLLKPNVLYKDGFYCLRGRDEIIEKRKKVKESNNEKLLLANKVARLLSHLPTIQFIGLSGSVATMNANKDDDIDFFIIVKKNSLWISRFFVLCFLELLGLRRKKNEKNEKDMICVNMIVDERSIAFSKNSQDIYMAHEIAQIRPLFDRNNTFQTFLEVNKWILGYMPNIPYQHKKTLRNKYQFSREMKNRIIHAFIYITNPVFRAIQLAKIKRTQTKEIVTDTFLAFHPIDYRKLTLTTYYKRLQQYQTEQIL